MHAAAIFENIAADLLQELLTAVGTKLTVEIVAILVVPALLIVLRALWKWLRGTDCKRRLDRAREAINSPKGLWTTKPVEPPQRYADRIQASIPILTVANLKGGVGKTTIAANLAAFYAVKGGPEQAGERVLLVDLDFQGSLSSLMLADQQRRPSDGISKASRLISGSQNVAQILSGAWPTTDPLWPPQAPRIRCIPSYYDLAQSENRLMVGWLIGDEGRDVRYHLADLLLDEALQREFDIVIIDAPPRLTTAAVQALCASTHVLIPTVMDRLSTEAVTTFVDQLETFKREQLCPYLRYAGIVGSMIGNGGDPEGEARIMMDAIRELHAPVELLTPEHWVRDVAALSKVAGQRIGYIRGSDPQDTKLVRDIFDRLGPDVRSRLHRQTAKRN